MNTHCQSCDRALAEGETAWAEDWTVIESGGARREVRYTCDACWAPA